MRQLDVATIRKALEDAGIEIYRSKVGEIQVAERVRLHMMDSGVRIFLGDDSARVCFTARSQRSDFPDESGENLLARVRASVGEAALARGYAESRSVTHEVKDPVDEGRVLDVWHEVTYEKLIQEMGALVDEVRWALTVEKYVAVD